MNKKDRILLCKTGCTILRIFIITTVIAIATVNAVIMNNVRFLCLLLCETQFFLLSSLILNFLMIQQFLSFDWGLLILRMIGTL